MNKVLLLRADATSPNLGVRVLKEGTEALVRRALGDDVTVHVQNFDGGDTGQKFNRQAIMRDVFRPDGPIKAVLRSYDLVIDVCGGDSFTDIYGLKRLALIYYTQRASQKLGVPTVLGPQTIGPFSTGLSRALATRTLKRMTLVLSRDNASRAEAAALGRPVDVSATDVVFALPVPEPAPRSGILVNVSGLLWDKSNSHVDGERYRESIHSLVSGLLRDGHKVTLLAHVLENERSDNDVPAVREVAAAFEGQVGVALPNSLSEVREIIARSRLVIGSRMHACLNALSTGTPAIPWAYSRKFEPLLSDIGWRYLVDLRSDADPAASTMEVIQEQGLGGLAKEASELLETVAARLEPVVDSLAGLTLRNG